MMLRRRDLLLLGAAALAGACVRRPVTVGVSRTLLAFVQGEPLPGAVAVPRRAAEEALTRARAALTELPIPGEPAPRSVALFRTDGRWRALDRAGTTLGHPVEPARDASRLVWESIPDGERWDGDTLRPLRNPRVAPLRELPVDPQEEVLVIYWPDVSPSLR